MSDQVMPISCADCGTVLRLIRPEPPDPPATAASYVCLKCGRLWELEGGNLKVPPHRLIALPNRPSDG